MVIAANTQINRISTLKTRDQRYGFELRNSYFLLFFELPKTATGKIQKYILRAQRPAIAPQEVHFQLTGLEPDCQPAILARHAS